MRDYAAALHLSEDEALKKGMEEKAVEFKKAGVEIYRKECGHAPLPGNRDEVTEVELDDALCATPAQRLAWLEDAMKLAWMAGATRDDNEINRAGVIQI